MTRLAEQQLRQQRWRRERMVRGAGVVQMEEKRRTRGWWRRR
nr:hypothetical protein [uncultured bacterium]